MYQNLLKALQAVVATLTDSPVEILLEKPKNPDHGDVACPVAMRLAKLLQRPPLEIAKQIVDHIELPEDVLECHLLAPGFLNFRFHDHVILQHLDLDSQTVRQAITRDYGQKVSLEHTAINPNKQPHVGHLRNACIGKSIEQILELLDYEVLTLYYHNDIGMQISCLVLALDVYDYQPQDFETSSEWASKAYQQITQDLADNQDLQARQLAIHKAMMDPYSKESDRAYELTLEILKNIFQILAKLGIDYDLVICESSIIDHHLWEETFGILKDKDSFYMEQTGPRKGCYVIDMPDEQEAKVIVRSNGIPTYAGNDITNHLWKFGLVNDFKYKQVDFKTQDKPLFMTSHTGEARPGFNQADSIINVIDTTQTYPQESVKQAFRALGYAEVAKNYHHINYGFVHLSADTARSLGIELEEGAKQVKISGRKGSVVTVNHLLSLMTSQLKSQFGDFEALQAVAVGAIKYEMLKIDTLKDMVFDIDRALDIKGNSGTYLMYTYARSQGILRKVDSVPTPDRKIQMEPKERALAGKIMELSDVIAKTHDALSPHLLCNYLYELCQVYNSFYNDCPVLNNPRSGLRIELVSKFAKALQQGLGLLGIQSVDTI